MMFIAGIGSLEDFISIGRSIAFLCGDASTSMYREYDVNKFESIIQSNTKHTLILT